MQENGVANAIQEIYRDLEYATTLTRQRASLSATPQNATTTTDQLQAGEGSEGTQGMDEEESWTFVEGYSDAEHLKNEIDLSNPKTSSSALSSKPSPVLPK